MKNIKVDKKDIEVLGKLLQQEKEIIENIIKNSHSEQPIWNNRYEHLNKLINKL